MLLMRHKILIKKKKINKGLCIFIVQLSEKSLVDSSQDFPVLWEGKKKKKEKRKKFQRNSEEKFSKGSVTVFGSRKKGEGGRGRGIPWKVKRKLKMVLARRKSRLLFKILNSSTTAGSLVKIDNEASLPCHALSFRFIETPPISESSDTVISTLMVRRN